VRPGEPRPRRHGAVGDEIGVDWSSFDLEQFRFGIALAHMKEFPDYYERLERMEEEAAREWVKRGRGA
jgi:Protein of unknown function (DUF5661)